MRCFLDAPLAIDFHRGIRYAHTLTVRAETGCAFNQDGTSQYMECGN